MGGGIGFTIARIPLPPPTPPFTRRKNPAGDSIGVFILRRVSCNAQWDLSETRTLSGESARQGSDRNHQRLEDE